MKEIRHVLLVSYDCVRADVAYRPDLEGVVALTRRGVRFDFALSPAPLTPVSHASVFTGRYPHRHGLRHLFRERMDTAVPLLARSMKRAGYETAAIVSCPGLNSWYGFSRGFDHFDDWVPPLPSGDNALSVKDVKFRGLALKRADMVAQRATEWLTQRDDADPWFLFIHFFDAHWPYEPPESFGAAANPYDGEIRFVDHYFQRVLAVLAERDWLDDTLTVLFGDHGEDLAGWYPNDKSGPDSPHPEEEGHGCLLFQQTQHVPLIFAHSKLPPHTVAEPVSLVDVYPTIAALTGAPTPAAPDGIDLSAVLAGDAAPPPRALYAETKYPRELVENTGKFDDIQNLQAVWLDRRRKVILPYGKPEAAIAYNLGDDPLEEAPLAIGRTGWSIADFPLPT